MTGPYAEQLLSGFDFYKPEVSNNLFRKKGDQGMSYFMILKSLGFEKPVARESYSWYMENYIHDIFTTTGASAGAAGAAVTYTLSAGSVNTIGSNDYVYPRKWDVVMFPNEVTGSVTAVTFSGGGTVTVTVKPNVSTDAIPAVSSGQELVIIGNAFAEGSDDPSGRLSGTTKETGYLQIIKEALTSTGSEMTNQDWFDTLVDESGPVKKILGYMMKGQIDLDYRQALAISTAMLFQKITDNTIVDTASTPASKQIQTMEGLIPAIRRGGNVKTYTPGFLDVSKFDEINKTLDAEFCGQDLACLLGFDLHTELENTLVDYFKDSEISYVVANQFGGDAGLAASVGFRSLKKGDRNFNFKRMGMFSHPKVGGASGYNFSKMGLFLPIDMRKDAKTGESMPSIGMRYKALGNYNRQMEVFDIRGAGPGQKVIAKDIANWYQRSHVGTQHVGLNRFVLLEAA